MRPSPSRSRLSLQGVPRSCLSLPNLAGVAPAPSGTFSVSARSEGDFPNWTLEFYQLDPRPLTSLLGARQGVYLYMFLLIAGILVFGLALTVRTVSHELELARIEEGRKKFAFEKVDMAALLQEILPPVRDRVRHDGFDIELEIDGPLPEVMADGEALAQAVTNLLDNAVK